MPVIELEDVCKSYGDLEVLTGVDLAVEQGEIYGILGPNGAGKTTLFQTMLGLLKQDSGSIRINGSSNLSGKEVKRQVGYLPSDVNFYGELTGRENLRYFAALADQDPDFDELLALVDLEDDADRRVGDYSTGMKKRLGIAQSLIKQPDIAIYDEPTTGLDPEGKNKFRRHIEKINREKDMTVIISSHITGEISPLCDRFGILADGIIKASGTKEELSEEAGSDIEIEVEVEEPGKAEQVFDSMGIGFQRDGNSFELQAQDDRESIVEQLVDAGAGVRDFRLKESTLENTYLELTG
ncbi:MAG: ABC transporter ATP-binding protein [Candidatus Nanohaloarchaea archaeon]